MEDCGQSMKQVQNVCEVDTYGQRMYKSNKHDTRRRQHTENTYVFWCDSVNRIRQVSKEKPELLVAHAYTRYLGDLSGGQILKKIAQRGMGLQGSKGLAFYEFDKINDESQFKLDYKAALDSLPIKENEAPQIIAEANIAFTLNMNIFSELEFSPVKVILGKIRNLVNTAQGLFLELKKN